MKLNYHDQSGIPYSIEWTPAIKTLAGFDKIDYVEVEKRIAEQLARYSQQLNDFQAAMALCFGATAESFGYAASSFSNFQTALKELEEEKEKPTKKQNDKSLAVLRGDLKKNGRKW